jgi:hypothetical protein
MPMAIAALELHRKEHVCAECKAMGSENEYDPPLILPRLA